MKCHYRRATSATAAINVGYLYKTEPPNGRDYRIRRDEGPQEKKLGRGGGRPLGKIEDDVIIVREHGSRGLYGMIACFVEFGGRMNG